MLPSTDDEEEELVQTKARKKHNKLDFSGEGLAGLLCFSWIHFNILFQSAPPRLSSY
jgi:hypothetical protein